MNTATATPGRPGITAEQITEAANTIAARGETPTLRSVRALLGSGSMGTIQKHLSAWQSQKRQIVTQTATLPTEIQRVILTEIEREIRAARTDLDKELAETKSSRDELAEENEIQAAAIDDLTAKIAALESTAQQQIGRIEQIESDLAREKEAAQRERETAEEARQRTVKAEMKLEALPALQGEIQQLREALDKANAKAAAAEQSAAVSAANHNGAMTRLKESTEREKATQQRLDKLEAAEKETAKAITAAIESSHQKDLQIRALTDEIKSLKAAEKESARIATAIESLTKAQAQKETNTEPKPAAPTKLAGKK